MFTSKRHIFIFFSRMMGNLGENLDWEDVKQMVRDADFDGDGKINYDDFVKMMMNWSVITLNCPIVGEI